MPETPAYNATILTSKDIVISKPNSTLQNKTTVQLPAAINNDLVNSSKVEALPVYAQKKWIPNKDELEIENIKNAPTFAKVKTPQQVPKNLTVVEVPEKEQNSTSSNETSVSTAQNIQIEEQRITNPDFKHHAGRSVTHMNNAAIQMAISAAAETSDSELMT